MAPDAPTNGRRNGHTGNGHAPDTISGALRQQLREAKAELRLAQLQSELKAIRANDYASAWSRRHAFEQPQYAAGESGQSGSDDLRESYDGYSGNAWGAYVDPSDSMRDDYLSRGGFFGVDRGRSKRDGAYRPFLWTDIDLDIQRSGGRRILTTNRFAQGAVKNLVNYTCKTGYKYEAAPRKNINEPIAPQLATVVNSFFEEFHAANDWPARERSTVLRSVRDGEVFARHFPQPDGMTWHRFVEPEIIYQPLGSPWEYSWGLLHARGDMERIVCASVAYSTPDAYEEVSFADDEMMMLKRNTDESVKRGLSDFYATGQTFDGTVKLLKNMIVAGGVQAAIAWIEQFTGPNGASVTDKINARRDQYQPASPNPFTGQTPNYTKYEAGSIPNVGSGREYVPPPVPVGALPS